MIPPKEFIRKIRPFSFLSEHDIDIIISGLEVVLFEKGKTIYRRGQTPEYVYLIFSGVVGLFDETAAVDYLSKEEIFGVMTVCGDPLNSTARAIEDTICYAIADRQFREVFDSDNRFAAYFSTLLKRRFRSFKTVASDKRILEETSFVLEIERIIYKRPVTCGPGLTIAAAAAEMNRNSVSSIVAVDADGMPVGILTHSDLGKVLVSGDRMDPVSAFMSSPVETIDTQSTIFEAYTKMIDTGIDHLVVTMHDKVSGVITRKDIQVHLEPSFSIAKLFRRIGKAASIGELGSVFESLMISVSKIAMSGPNFFDLTRMLCSVHDTAVKKVINILRGEPPGGFLWVHMGSSGRKEEAIATDQDNALIQGENCISVQADEINAALAEIGIPKCLGNYMASNPMWNQPLQVWKEYFAKWFSDPVPYHLRYLSVFLDMRPLYGETQLYDELIASIKLMVKNEAVKLMAADAIEIRPPLGIFGILGLHHGVDLKTYGLYPIVNGARVLSVDKGIWGITNTKERLEALNADMIIGDGMCRDLIESYGFLQDLRLKHHARAMLKKMPISNLITAGELSHEDLLVLKESLKVVAEFQKFLMKKYGVSRTVIYSQL
ncbi:MAG TPA: putative nucleotidyltransferase substrate binding domain-containing protein [Dissulfurispiraceae bacterium]|nr:putative nucleotidyltransferase substrate binding domain-containing protein [Dissulfurispiraceae bacterium]